MNTISKFIMGAGMALVLSSCDKVNSQIDTVINDDGSCYRQVTVLTDRFTSNYAGWDTVMHSPYEKIKTGTLEACSSSPIVEARFARNFNSVHEMCESWSKFEKKNWAIKSVGHLKTQFKWFYTVYTFRESFRFPDGLITVPPTNYLKPEECSFWSTGRPDILEGLQGNNMATVVHWLDKRVENWRYDLILNKFMDIFVEHWDELENPPVSKNEFNEKRGMVISMWNSEKEFKFGLNDCDAFLDEFFKTDAFSNACRSESNIYKAISAFDKNLKGLCGKEYNCTLKMPGTIMDSNVGSITDNVLHYRLSADLLVDHYDVIVISRKANVWAFVITILVLATAVASHYIKIRK